MGRGKCGGGFMWTGQAADKQVWPEIGNFCRLGDVSADRISK